MRTKNTKLLALLLTLVMVLGMLPMAALAAEGDPAPAPAITVEITDAPTSVLKTATEVKVEYKGTNTGNVPLSFNSCPVKDKDDNNVLYTSYSYECEMDGGSYVNLWVNPGKSFDFTVTYNILPADKAEGKLIRKYTQIAKVISQYSGGEYITCEAQPVTVEIPLVDPESTLIIPIKKRLRARTRPPRPSTLSAQVLPTE